MSNNKQYRHKKTGNIVAEMYNPGGHTLYQLKREHTYELFPAWVVEDSVDWELLPPPAPRIKLFTSADGVDIYTGDTCWFIGAFPSWTAIKIVHASDIGNMDQRYKYFSTLEKAEEYILYNKPCLSIKEILNIRRDGSLVIYKQELYDYVKLKLNVPTTT